jgi:DNA-binding NtrC family response regulator
MAVPPLRERYEDIPRLVETFVERLRQLYGKDIQGTHLSVFEAMRRYSWPGNVRELENLVERAFILERQNVLMPESFPRELFDTAPNQGNRSDLTALPLAEARQRWVEDMEKRYLRELLAQNGGRIAPTALAAGVGPRQLHKLLTKHAIRKETFKKKTRR